MNTEWIPPSDAIPAPPLRYEDREGWPALETQAPRSLVRETLESTTTWLPTGRLVNLRFFRAALRRLRWVWLTAAALGLLVGVGYHLAVPLRYSATATLYLVQPTTGTGSAPNDLAMLNTNEVSKRAVALLREPGLSPTSLLGKQPGAMTSSNVLVLTISGPSPQEAVRRVDAVASAFLSFRAERYAAQNRAVLAAEHRQLTALRQQLAGLSSQVARLGSGTSVKATALQSQQAIDTTQIVSLESSIQQTALGTLAVARGSRVISPGTALPVSKKKVFGLDGLGGLLGGLGAGVFLVAVAAVLSDRPRTREDIAAVLGAPVDLSLRHVGRHSVKKRSLWTMAAHPSPELSVLAQHLEECLPRGTHAGAELVVAIDDISVTATSLVLLAGELARSGRQPVLVDATDSRQLARAFGIDGAGTWRLNPATGFPLEVLVPPQPWESAGDALGQRLESVERADVVLVLATVDPALGAQHLRRWASTAIVTLHAGTSSAQRVGAVGELLRAAGLTISSVVLLDADARDESAGRAPVRPAWDW